MKRKSKTATRRPARSGGGGGRARAGETAHARRVRKYLEKHPGATKAQARGHKPREHAERERRAKAAGKLTEKERAAIRRYADQQAKRIGDDPDDLYRKMTDTFGKPGGGADFAKMKATRDRLTKRKARSYRRRIRKGVARFSGDLNVLEENISEMDDAMADLDLPDARWLWYR